MRCSYKAENVIDVVVYRGSDALYGWLFDALQGIGLKLVAFALCALPVAAGWMALSGVLGRAHERLADRPASRSPNGAGVQPATANASVAERRGVIPMWSLQ